MRVTKMVKKPSACQSVFRDVRLPLAVQKTHNFSHRQMPHKNAKLKSSNTIKRA